MQTLKFEVTITFSDPITSYDEIKEVRQNVEDAIESWRGVQLAPSTGDNYTTSVQVDHIEDEVQHAKEVLFKNGTLEIFWNKNDIRFYELGEGGKDDEGNEIPPLTEEEVDQIAKTLEKYHDASYGMNWDSILCEVNNVLSNRGGLRSL